MTTSRAALAFVALSVTACASAPLPAASADLARQPGSTAGAPPAPNDAALAPRTSSEPAAQCRMSFSDTSGCAPADVEKLIAPVRQRIEECRGDKGGQIRVRLRGADGKLGFEVEPGASLDPRERRCILDALATIPGENMPGDGRGVPSTGFTSMLTIEW